MSLKLNIFFIGFGENSCRLSSFFICENEFKNGLPFLKKLQQQVFSPPKNQFLGNFLFFPLSVLAGKKAL